MKHSPTRGVTLAHTISTYDETFEFLHSVERGFIWALLMIGHRQRYRRTCCRRLRRILHNYKKRC